MIPPDVANSLRQILPDLHSTANAQTQPVLPTQRIADVLGNLVPGQRLLAEVQALLPNGTYRAVVAQRDITLALPFSAKPGDSLELEVVETDGKVALAYVAGRPANPQAGLPEESVPTQLSRTGKLIGDLLGNIDSQGKRATPAPLNGNQPLVSSMPATAAELAPVLKQALTQSGMFYEAHQARWVAGELPATQLLREPQGQLSPGRPPAAATPTPMPGQAPVSGPATATGPTPMPGEALERQLATELTANPAAAKNLAATPAPLIATGNPSPNEEQIVATQPQRPPTASPVTDNDRQQPASTLPSPSQTVQAEARSPLATRAEIAYYQQAAASGETTAAEATRIGQGAAFPASTSQPATLPPEIAPLVQQQLDALATQTFAWQGQIWPGQEMTWEINEDQGNRQSADENENGQWQTRLKLTLPQLGEIEASLRLRQGQGIELSLAVEQSASGEKLGAAGELLKQQFAAAGLNLSSFSIKHDSPGE